MKSRFIEVIMCYLHSFGLRCRCTTGIHSL